MSTNTTDKRTCLFVRLFVRLLDGVWHSPVSSKTGYWKTEHYTLTACWEPLPVIVTLPQTGQSVLALRHAKRAHWVLEVIVQSYVGLKRHCFPVRVSIIRCMAGLLLNGGRAIADVDSACMCPII